MRFIWLQTFAVSALAQSGAPLGSAYWNANGRFVGSDRCAACHRKQAETYRASSMSRALEPVGQCAILNSGLKLTFQSGAYAWSIVREGAQVLYRVTDGNESLEAPIEYAFGQGKAGQTYLFSYQGKFYESRVSYYAELRGLDLTIGARNSKPRNLADAAGRAMEGNEPRACFGCHTTGARLGPELQLKHFEYGIQCESCHGPGGTHTDAIASGKPIAGTIRSLRGMGPQESNEFCGVCHRTWDTVMSMGIQGIDAARFPAYGLTNSKCFSPDDRRISCTACHDPHAALVTDSHYYDAKCTACHNPSNAAIARKTCPVGKETCTVCHMPKAAPPGAHHAFPDHWIRVAKGEYPR